jgi:hypothetical protein
LLHNIDIETILKVPKEEKLSDFKVKKEEDSVQRISQ